MALKGNLRDFNLTQLLNLINLARKTGALTLTSPQGEAKLFFKEGRLVYASRNNDEGSLLTMLLDANKITAEQARAIQGRAQVNSDKAIGLLLVNAGHLTQKDILQSVRKHLLEVAYPLFTWDDGLFRFEPNLLPGPHKITAPVELENLILEGSRRLHEWEMLLEEIPDLEASLHFAKRPETSLRKVSLSATEWRVISFIDPRNSIRQIARKIGLSDFEIRRIVFGLISAGLVEMARPTGRPQELALPESRVGASRDKAKLAPPPIKRGIILKIIDRIRGL